ncbi:hypothetical protein ABK040_012201 [Willaertia magna]
MKVDGSYEFTPEEEENNDNDLEKHNLEEELSTDPKKRKQQEIEKKQYANRNPKKEKLLRSMSQTSSDYIPNESDKFKISRTPTSSNNSKSLLKDLGTEEEPSFIESTSSQSIVVHKLVSETYNIPQNLQLNNFLADFYTDLKNTMFKKENEKFYYLNN